MSSSNEEYLSFGSHEVFTFEEFDQFLKNVTNPITKAKLLAKNLFERIMINKGEIYLYNAENVTYKKIVTKTDKALNEYLLMLVRIFLVESYDNLDKSDKKRLKEKHKSQMGPNCDKLFKITYCKDFITDIANQLVNNDIQFDDVNKYEIHFANGYMDLDTLKFQPRDPEVHFISKNINRHYVKSPTKLRRDIMKEIMKILPRKDERDHIFSTLGKSLSGDVVKDQSNLILLGPGANGKSVIMKLIKLALDMYIIELKNDTFTQGNTKIDKILNEFQNCKYLRYAWINEMEDKKINQSLFKSFCEGYLQTTTLYKDGLNNFNHNCKLVFTSNDFPNIRIDGGTTRRMDACTMSSKFVDTPDQVDEANHKYLKNAEFLNVFEENDSYKNAFFDILCEYCKEWIDDPHKYPVPETFKDCKGMIVDLNDIVGNFLNNNLVITNDEKNKIDRDVLYQRFMLENPKSIITTQQFFNNVIHKDVKFNRQARDSRGSKGCYVCIKFKGEQDLSEMDDEEVKALKASIRVKDDQITEMKAEIDKLRKLCTVKTEEVVYPVKTKVEVKTEAKGITNKPKQFSDEELDAFVDGL
jgi:hypothetical protein